MKRIYKILFLIFVLLTVSASVSAANIYVDSTSDADTENGTEALPYKTIQPACDAAQAGDTVIVKKGIYYGTVHIKNKGTKEKPITVKGEKGAIITNADRTIRENASNAIWTLVDAGLGLYSAPLTLEANEEELVFPDKDNLFPTRMLYDNVDLLQYPTLDALKTFVLNDNDTYRLDGYSHGYYYDCINKKIYVRLRADGKYGSPDPNKHVMAVSPSYYTKTALGSYTYGLAPGEGSFNIIVGNDGTMDDAVAAEKTLMDSFYVIIDGFTFETPGLAGIMLRASDVTVQNCDFYGCRFAVKGASRVYYDMAYCKNIKISHSEYTQFPTYDDAEEFIIGVKSGNKQAVDNSRDDKSLKYSWWHKKSNGTDAYGINSDLRYEVGGFVGNIGEDWEICNNYVHNVFDAISLSAMSMYTERKTYSGKNYSYAVGASGIKIYNNKFERCLDNCIEFEERGKNIEVYGNEFTDNFLPLSWQPTKGPDYPTNISVHNNLVYNTPAFGHFWSQTANYANFAFKIGATTVSWEFPWSDEVPADGKPVIALGENGLDVYNNTFIMPYGYPIAFSISNRSDWAEFSPTFEGIKFRSNALLGHVKKTIGDGYVFDGVSASTVGGVGNYIKGDMGIEYSGNIFAPDMNDGVTASEFTGNGGEALDGFEAFKFNALTMRRYDVGASDDSPLYDFDEGYAGAVPKGASYTSPKYGRAD